MYIWRRNGHRSRIQVRKQAGCQAAEKPGGMVGVLDLLADLPADMFPKKRKDPQPQRRRGL